MTIDWSHKLQTPVAVLYGGTSAERDISLQSGTAVAQALESQGVATRLVDTAEPDWLSQIQAGIKHCFIALHGVNGEDGKIQAVLEFLGVTYTGSGVLASALAMDKSRSKQLWQGIGIATPAFTLLDENSDWQAVIDQFGCVFVKPAAEGSSIGMAKVDNAADLAKAWRDASRYDSLVLAEQFVDGHEYTVAILDGQVLPAIKLETDHSFYDYDAKYLANDTRYLCPCGLDQSSLSELNQLAADAFNSLGCRGWGRVDVMQDRSGQFYVLEVNTVPGMTSHSLVPMAAKAVAMSFEQLVARILLLSLEAA